MPAKDSLTLALPSFLHDLPLARKAFDFAARHHGEQRRDADFAPFILHPLEVANLLRGRDYPDTVIAAGVLHDVVEDANVPFNELEQHFGTDVSALVRAVTEPTSEGSFRQRKARLREAIAVADGDAVAIYAADKVAKTRELRMRIARTDAKDLDPEKLDHYWASLRLLETRLGHHPFVRQLRFELETLHLLPPHTTAKDAPGATPAGEPSPRQPRSDAGREQSQLPDRG
jgi:(p)ppGpp synthase/HD superfamily hydrolase